MFRKLLISLLSFFLLVTFQLFVASASSSAEKSIQLYVNNVKIEGVHPKIMSGVMYVPYRPFFSALGFKVTYNIETRQISGIMGDSEIQFWANEDIIEYDGLIYYLDNAIPVINEQVYLPLRLISNLSKYSVSYDKSKSTVRLESYGLGEDAAIKGLLTKYYETFSPQLYSSDNLKLGYMNLEYDYEANKPVSEIEVRDYKVTMDWIKYISASKAQLQVTFSKNTEVLNLTDVYLFDIRYEREQWKIANEALIFKSMETPVDIDKQATSIMENRYGELSTVLSDLKIYYKALNEENLELTVQYTDPLFIEQWNEVVFGSKTWDSLKKESFAYSDYRYNLSDERVVFLGDNEAVVQGKVDFSIGEDDEEGVNNEYEALIYLKYSNGHWTYSDEINLDQDFDERVDSLGNPAKLSGW
ncbi:copper amine oxidase N-terminal domain-containing protein [Paenibacillus shunpengii]|uniref:Copper amine oxidase N-terminal domain-containing protein n=1 Tax=Paenibacillus shunpengii TaxID=2054424 RepID=A0ABW5SIP3_9BACL